MRQMTIARVLFSTRENSISLVVLESVHGVGPRLGRGLGVGCPPPSHRGTVPRVVGVDLCRILAFDVHYTCRDGCIFCLLSLQQELVAAKKKTLCLVGKGMVQCKAGSPTGAALIRYLGFWLPMGLGSRKGSSFRPSRPQEITV